MTPHSLFYWIALKTEAPGMELSPFQGISFSLLKRSDLIRHILKTLPPNIFDLYSYGVGSLQARIAGLSPYTVAPLHVEHFVKLPVGAEFPFHVVFTDKATDNDVRDALAVHKHPILRVNVDAPAHNCALPLSRHALIDYCTSVMQYLKSQVPAYSVIDFDSLLKPARPSEALSIGIDSFGHNATVPNELAMQSLGCHVQTHHEPLCGPDDIYVKAITTTADALATLCRLTPNSEIYAESPPVCSLMITTPGLFLDVRRHRRPKGATSNGFDEGLRIFQQQTTYSMQADSSFVKHIQNNDRLRLCIGVRAEELNAFSSIIAVRSSSYLTPVIRLPPSLDHVASHAIKLADAIRAATIRPRSRPLRIEKLRKLSESLFSELESRTDRQYRDRLSRRHSHVKIISDAPLEWLPVKGLPLMLRHSASRIPVTPGNVSIQQVLPRAQVSLSMDDFSEVLVIRSFGPNDPSRQHLQTAVQAFPLSTGKAIPARFVDVRNRKELLAAFDKFSGAMAILDCHGVHDKDAPAKLSLSDETVDFDPGRIEARIPPIIITSACDTFALARNHATIANGLLGWGAVTVLATALPVRSTDSAIFVGRLLFRVYEYLAAISSDKWKVFIRWDQVISQLQRMMFLSEFVNKVTASHEGPKDWDLQTLSDCTMVIHRTGPMWYEQSLEILSKGSCLSKEELEKLRKEKLPFPETLKYIQMGNPELIVFGPSKSSFGKMAVGPDSAQEASTDA